MDRNRWIVVGIDFSDGATRALECAVKLAAEIGANVACVHAYEDTAATPACHDPTKTLQVQIEDLIASSTCCDGKVRVDAVVRRGAPWEKLANVATELGAELIVVGADGQRGASSEHFLGTVASRLATASSRSVVIVPSRTDGGSSR
jgi:nucleotide-binding universal stress UspA family protein